jgi:hypothetical protein
MSEIIHVGWSSINCLHESLYALLLLFPYRDVLNLKTIKQRLMDWRSKQVKNLLVPRHLLLRILHIYNNLHYCTHLHKEIDLQCGNSNLSYLLIRSYSNGWLFDCKAHLRIMVYEWGCSVIRSLMWSKFYFDNCSVWYQV